MVLELHHKQWTYLFLYILPSLTSTRLALLALSLLHFWLQLISNSHLEQKQKQVRHLGSYSASSVHLLF